MKKLLLTATLVLGCLFALLLVSIFWNSPDDDPGTNNSPNTVKQNFPFKSHEECRECHPKIYEEWESSWHKSAWTDPAVRGSWGCYRDQDCKSCHLPEPLLANGERPFLNPRSEEDSPESGVNCLTCHISPQGVLAPYGRDIQMTKHCNPIKHDLISTDKNCWQCHPNQYDDWHLSSFSKEPNKKGCKDCHMEQVRRPVVLNGPERLTRVHYWKGAHTYTFLKTAYSFSSELTEKGVSVSVGNPNSGHFFPAERHNRALWVEVYFFDASGDQIGDNNKWVIREGSNNPRNMKTLDIKPDGTINKVFPVPEGCVKAETKLFFDYFYSNEDEHTRLLEGPVVHEIKK